MSLSSLATALISSGTLFGYTKVGYLFYLSTSLSTKRLDTTSNYLLANFNFIAANQNRVIVDTSFFRAIF